jgi:hypothetical protein
MDLSRMTKVRRVNKELNGKHIRAHKIKEFKLGGYARSQSMGFRIYKVITLKPFSVLNLGNLNVGAFSLSTQMRIKEPRRGSGWYEPVELYEDPVPNLFRRR